MPAGTSTGEDTGRPPSIGCSVVSDASLDALLRGDAFAFNLTAGDCYDLIDDNYSGVWEWGKLLGLLIWGYFSGCVNVSTSIFMGVC